MIVRPRPNLFELFFIIKGSIVLRIIPLLLFVAVLSALIVLTYEYKPGLIPNFDGAPFALLGIALSIFLAFRNNACYDRWWEARKHWGNLVAASRNLARQTLILQEAGGRLIEVRKNLLRLNIAYVHALAVHLRHSAEHAKVSMHLSPQELEAYLASRNSPEVILMSMEQILIELKNNKTIDSILFKLLDETVLQFALTQSACERILNTPIPFGYTLLLHRTAYTFCFLMPFGFANNLGWATPFVTVLAAYTFFGLDALGNELEEPFGNSPNCVPIAALADTIEINIKEVIQDYPIPQLPLPQDFILM